MQSLCGSTYWTTTSKASRDYPSLPGDTQVDVAVIGAGITGLTAALHLKRAGLKVAVLESGRVGGGTTGGTTGHLDVSPDTGARTLIGRVGEATARTVTVARAAAIDQIEAWCGEFGIECDFRRIPAYLYSETPDGAQELAKECEAAQRIGVPAVMKDNLPLPIPHAGGFQIDRQARFHALNYLHGLAQQVDGDGSAIYEQTRAHPPQDGTPCLVETDHGKVTAAAVIVCTHSAFLGISTLDMRVAPYQSYVIAIRVNDTVPDALCWDDAEPYYYWRRASTDDPQLLLVGGADHKTGQANAEEAIEVLKNYARERFRVHAIEQTWSAEFFEPADGLPYTGRVPFKENVYVATGFSGTGLTFGTLSGGLLAELVQKHESPLENALAPTRFSPMAEGKELVSENLNVARRFIGDRITTKRIDSLEEVPAGEGRLVRIDGQALAVYRNAEGHLHTLSPMCTHAGCFVHWNQLEHTWDCPCHGGRYTAEGERIYGPPLHDLKHVDISLSETSPQQNPG